MSNIAPSIFNDILGPVMVGPSSSHTCGPARIGYLCGQLVAGRIKRAEFVFARDGSYPNTYKGQRSDLGFVGGLLGIREYDPELCRAFDAARAAGLEYSFSIEDHHPPTPNHVIVRLWREDGRRTEVHADSTGGGTLRIMRIDDLDVEIYGDAYELLVFCAASAVDAVLKEARAVYPEAEAISSSAAEDRGLVAVTLRASPSDAERARFRALAGVEEAILLQPAHTVLSNRRAQMPFSSAEEILLAANDGQSLGELGIAYEMTRADWSRAQVLERMDLVIDIMERGAERALSGDVRGHGILQPTSAGIARNDACLNLGVLNLAVPWAMGVMEVNGDMGVVVGGPTGGSAGVIPGAVLGVARQMGLSQERKRLAMFAAGLTGIVISSKGCNFSAELFGCQIEVGAASVLAAAGLVEALGGTVKQAFSAAATATHNILGLICDPVAGMVELPCISRNAMGVANAAICANMVMGGYDPLIGLDESAEVLIAVGRGLPAEFRCTGLGGLCTCKTGRKLFDEQQVRNNLR